MEHFHLVQTHVVVTSQDTLRDLVKEDTSLLDELLEFFISFAHSVFEDRATRRGVAPGGLCIYLGWWFYGQVLGLLAWWLLLVVFD